MEKWKKFGKALLFPHIALLWVLLPIAIGLLVYALVCLAPTSPLAGIAYLLSAYTLTIWCCRIPRIIAFFKNFKAENKYAQIWFGDERLRINVGLFRGYAWNGAYGIFHLWLGIYHGSFWYCSLALYYFLLARMRYGLSRHARHFAPGEDLPGQWKRYRNCGVVLLFMNLALALMVFFMIYWGRTFRHHPITTIAMAACTFTSFTLAVVDMVRYRSTPSPVYSASKAISLAAACVSMLTLTATMLTAFDQGNGPAFRQIMLGSVGGAVSLFIIGMAVYMILRTKNHQ